MLSTITSESIQRWTRIILYYIFGAVGYGGVTSGFDWRPMVVSAVGFGVTAIWTKYGSTVDTMLTEIEKTDGVKKVEVAVDPSKIAVVALNKNTPDAVVVKPA